MRVGGVVFILLALGARPAAAADPAERVSAPRTVERTYRMTAAAERYYGPRVPLPGVTDQVVVDRGPRLLIEEDFFGLFEPNFAARRLPSRVRLVPVEAEHPWYRPPEETYPVRERRRSVRRPSKG